MRKIIVILCLACLPAYAQTNTFIPSNGAVVKTANYTAVSADVGTAIVMNCSGCTLTLPDPIPFKSWMIWVQNLNAAVLSVNPLTRTIGGVAGIFSVSASSGVLINSDGTNYFALSIGTSSGGAGNTNSIPLIVANCTSGGTVASQLVQLATQGVPATVCATNAVANSISTIGVCSANCGTAGNATIGSTTGTPTCRFDGSTTVGDFVSPSATPGLCHDIGTTPPTTSTVQNVGTVFTPFQVVGQSSQVLWGSGSIITPPGSGIVNQGANLALPYYATAGRAVSGNTGATLDAIGNLTAKTVTTNAPGTSVFQFLSGTAPTTPPAGFVALYF